MDRRCAWEVAGVSLANAGSLAIRVRSWGATTPGGSEKRRRPTRPDGADVAMIKAPPWSRPVCVESDSAAVPRVSSGRRIEPGRVGARVAGAHGLYGNVALLVRPLGKREHGASGCCRRCCLRRPAGRRRLIHRSARHPHCCRPARRVGRRIGRARVPGGPSVLWWFGMHQPECEREPLWRVRLGVPPRTGLRGRSLQLPRGQDLLCGRRMR